MKQYNGEKAIISLTSWKARIKTVSKTIYSLIQKCPDYHIVLVLSEEEFPQKEAELPNDLMLFVDNNLIELLWVYKNYKSFKKVLFTMDKYRDVPVISADDGQIYKDNFAEKLYKIWLKFPTKIISNTHFKYDNTDFGAGCRGILYPPYCFGISTLLFLNDKIIKTNHDDAFIGVLAKLKNVKWHFTNKLNVKVQNFIIIKNAEKVGLTINKRFKNNAFKTIKKEILNQIKIYKSKLKTY